MRVVFIHGVSDGSRSVGYNERLQEIDRLFRTEVVGKLTKPRQMAPLYDISWSQMRPDARLQVGPRARNYERLGPGDDGMNDDFALADYVAPSGAASLAAIYEAALFRTSGLTDEDIAVGRRVALDLLGRAALQLQGDSLAQANIVRAQLEASAQQATGQHETMDESTFRRTVRRVNDAVLNTVQKGVELVGVRPRDWVAREMAGRWLDIVWYFGAGRANVQKEVLQKLDVVARGTDGDPIVVLGHSLGGLIAFEALNSDDFRDRYKLHQKAKWILLLFGAQIPMYSDIGVTPNADFRAHLNHIGRYKNIVDKNDPLGFAFGDDQVDLVVTTGVNTLKAHSSYLLTPTVLPQTRKVLDEFLKELA